MTVNPNAIGDKGQRYKVVARFDSGEKDIAYSNTLSGAEKLLKAIKLWPACTHEKIIDRNK